MCLQIHTNPDSSTAAPGPRIGWHDFLWFFFPLVCWGIGLTLHYLGVNRWGAQDVRRRQEQIEHQAEAMAR
jgi:hypothetical protein